MQWPLENQGGQGREAPGPGWRDWALAHSPSALPVCFRVARGIAWRPHCGGQAGEESGTLGCWAAEPEWAVSCGSVWPSPGRGCFCGAWLPPGALLCGLGLEALVALGSGLDCACDKGRVLVAPVTV